MKMNKNTVAVVALFGILMGMPLEGLAQQRVEERPRTGSLAAGVQLGLHAGTADDDAALALGFNADYYLDPHFSLGPLLQFGFTGDLTQIGMSVQTKYTFELPRAPQVRPHLQGGLGFLHVDMDRPPVPVGGEDSDLGFLVPFGGGFELELNRNLLVGTTLLLNFTDADVATAQHVENVFMTWFFGLRIIL